jgi:hypothetical protein
MMNVVVVIVIAMTRAVGTHVYFRCFRINTHIRALPCLRLLVCISDNSGNVTIIARMPADTSLNICIKAIQSRRQPACLHRDSRCLTTITVVDDVLSYHSYY